MNKIQIIFSVVITGLIIMSSCKSNEENNGTKNNSDSLSSVTKENPLKLKVEDATDDNYEIGDIISISIEDSSIKKTDSVTLLINKENVTVLTSINFSYTWNSKDTKTGKNLIEIELNKDGSRFRKQHSIILLSDIEPETYTYKVKKVYKHDVNAYTQGLFYHDGYLYEATGMKGESTVRKVKLETGEVIQSFAISKDIFGEGIVLYDNKIIQLSWEAGKGYVYDFNTFKLLDEFSYIGEGWGICTDNKNLFMTNGSSQIKVLETQSYSEMYFLEAYDNQGELKYLNELEYIDDFIYANIYNYNKIAKIDPTSGKVVAYIDLSGILPMNDYTNKTDVLNGIA